SQGRSVLLLEKSLKEPDRIIGELLQPGGVRALEKLGMRECLEGIDAITVRGYNVIYHGESVAIPYPENETAKDGTPYEGRAFHHGRFISKLREAARKTPNVTVVETTVTELVKSTDGPEVLGVLSSTDGKPDYYFAPLTVVADGYASKFRKQYHRNTPQVKSKFYGLELIDATLPLPGFGHVLVSDKPPILLYQIGTHETRILCDIPENLPSASVKAGGVKNHLRNVVLPSLPEKLQKPFEAALDEGKIRSMPNSFLPSSTNRTPGLIFVGDSLNMRHPLTGGGMTCAFNDVVTVSEMLAPANVPDLNDTHRVLKQMEKFHWVRKSKTSVINILAMALYSLFAANNENLVALQRGCFRYFQLGLVKGPVSLLAGIVTQQLVLFRHFFAVAFLAMWEVLKSEPIIFLPLTLLKCVQVLWTACVVLFPFIYTEYSS
ncbi:Squalene epoxidase, partial [Ascosphaera atra]